MTKKRQYKNELRNHLDDVNEMSGFPESGLITLTFDIESGEFTSTIVDGIQTKDDTGSTGRPFP